MSGPSAIRIDSALVHRYNRDSGVTNMSRELAQTILGPLNVSIFLFGLVIFLTRKKGDPRKKKKYIVALLSLALLAGILSGRANELSTVTFSGIEEAAQYAQEEGAELVLLGTDSCFVAYPTSKGTEIMVYALGKNGVVKKGNSWPNIITRAENGLSWNVWFVQEKGSADQYVFVSGQSREEGLEVYDSRGTVFSVQTEDISVQDYHVTHLCAVGLLDMNAPGFYTITLNNAVTMDRLTVERQADGSFVQVK